MAVAAAIMSMPGELELGQQADGDGSAEEGHDSSRMMKQARAAITIKKFILRRSCWQ